MSKCNRTITIFRPIILFILVFLLIVTVSEVCNPLYAEAYDDNENIQNENISDPDPTADTTYRTISIDGLFTDWEGIQPVCENIVVMNDDAGIDLAKVWLAHNDNWLYLRFETGNVINLQGMDAIISLSLNIDGDDATGIDKTKIGGSVGLKGADIELLFSPEIKRGNNSAFYGAAAYAYTYAINKDDDNEQPAIITTKIDPYRLQASFAPTTAASQFELRIKRGILIEECGINTFTNQTVSGLIVTKTRSGLVIDHTDTFKYSLSPVPTVTDSNFKNTATENTYNVPVVQLEDQGVSVYALSKRKPDSVRYITWNVEQGSMFENPGPFSRVLYALQPDVICFQELGTKTTTSQLIDWLDEYVPERMGWEAKVSPETGTGIATRLPNSPAGPGQMPELSMSNRKLRATTMMISSSGGPGRRFATMSTHMKCCGIAGDSSDLKRIDEAEIIHTLMNKIRIKDNPSAIVITGDFNLVGSKKPLDIIAAKLDYDSSNLLVVNPYILCDNTNTTWRDNNQPFLPGRLDYVLVSDSTVKVERTFILDTTKLDNNTLKYYNIQTQDTQNASDHLPLVVDLIW